MKKPSYVVNSIHIISSIIWGKVKNKSEIKTFKNLGGYILFHCE